MPEILTDAYFIIHILFFKQALISRSPIFINSVGAYLSGLPGSEVLTK